MGPLLLCIDTAGSRCATALLDMARGDILARADPDIGRGHAERLIGIVSGALAEAGATYGDLVRIAVVVGPGSFTGLRVGLSAAKGLALALGIEAVGVSALEALAEPHRGEGREVLAVIDAKRDELYAALYDADGRELFAPCAVAPGHLSAVLQAGSGGVVLAVGSGAAIAAERLGTRVILRGPGDGPDIAAVARIGAGRGGAVPLTPLYLRGADAKPQGPTGVSLRMAGATLP